MVDLDEAAFGSVLNALRSVGTKVHTDPLNEQLFHAPHAARRGVRSMLEQWSHADATHTTGTRPPTHVPWLLVWTGSWQQAARGATTFRIFCSALSLVEIAAAVALRLPRQLIQ